MTTTGSVGRCARDAAIVAERRDWLKILEALMDQSLHRRGDKFGPLSWGHCNIMSCWAYTHRISAGEEFSGGPRLDRIPAPSFWISPNCGRYNRPWSLKGRQKKKKGRGEGPTLAPKFNRQLQLCFEQQIERARAKVWGLVTWSSPKEIWTHHSLGILKPDLVFQRPIFPHSILFPFPISRLDSRTLSPV